MREVEHASSGPTLVVAGYLNIDLVARVPALPGHDGRITASVIERLLGGIACNVACAAAALGPPWSVAAELLTVAGDDPDSAWALAEVVRRGVAVDGVPRRTGGRVTYCLILVEPGGARAIVSEPMAFDDDLVGRRIAQPAPGTARRGLHVDGYRLPGILPQMAAARAAGWHTSVDLDGLTGNWRTPARLADLLAAFDVIFLNRSLAGAFWPAVVTSEPATAPERDRLAVVAAAARAAAPAQPGRLLLTLGAGGALLVDDGPPIVVPAWPVDPIDTTGAGDVFAGAYLATWLNGEPPARAASYAAVAAALSTLGHGALGALPTADAVLAAARLAGQP